MPTVWNGPIFVCGPSRSGTALVRSIINGSGRAFLAGETHYFDDLRTRLGEGKRRQLGKAEARLAQDYFLALSHRPYGHAGDPERGRIKREDLVRLADELGGSGDGYLEAYCRLEAKLQGAPVWGEKTPRHVFRIGDILAAYPRAKLVCLIRDPRAVVASYRDWKNQGGFDFEVDPGHRKALAADHERARRSYNPIIASLLWRGATLAAANALATFGPERVRLQRYEELIASPEEAVRSLAEWLGIPFVETMMEVPVHNSSYQRYNAKGGIVTGAVDRWRQKMSPEEVAIIESACRRTMCKHGYAAEAPRGTSAAVFRAWCSLPFAVGRAVVANRSRIPSLPRYISVRLLPFVRT